MQVPNWQCGDGAPFCLDYSIVVMAAFFAIVTAVVGLIAFMKIRNYRLRRLIKMDD